MQIAEAYLRLHRPGSIYYCEYCLFCHTDTEYFDVDHLVPDKQFRDWGKHEQSAVAVSMMLLCKSLKKGDLGCNQSKDGQLYVPVNRGLAYTLRDLDMNCTRLKERPLLWT